MRPATKAALVTCLVNDVVPEVDDVELVAIMKLRGKEPPWEYAAMPTLFEPGMSYVFCEEMADP